MRHDKVLDLKWKFDKHPFCHKVLIKLENYGELQLQSLGLWHLPVIHIKLKFSEKATKFDKISILVLTFLCNVKNKMEILSNFVAFSEYVNFILSHSCALVILISDGVKK